MNGFDPGSFFTEADFFALKPVVLLCLFGCGILLTGFLLRQGRWNALTALIGEAFVAVSVWQHFSDVSINSQRFALNGSLVVDGFSVFFNALFVGSAVLAIIISVRYLEQEGANRGEYYALILFAQAGMSIMASGYDLVTLFVGLELMALSFYVMVGFLRGQLRANEAAMKYLLLGAFSSGFLAYGFSLFYGLSGSTVCDRLPRPSPHASRATLFCCWRLSRRRWDCFSRSPSYRSTCGLPTCMKARPRPSPPTFRWRRRLPRSLC